MRWRYLYPQAEFPYGDLVAVNRARGHLDPEYELADTGVFDAGRYWEITAEYAKADPEDICLRVRVRNAGPEAAPIDLLAMLWFRNTWSWGLDDRRPAITRVGNGLAADHWLLGRHVLTGADGAEALFCENETNFHRLYGSPPSGRAPKDGINDHVVGGRPSLNGDGTGTRAALRHHLSVGAGASVELRFRLGREAADLGGGFEAMMSAREADADRFYSELTPPGATLDEAAVMRQAFAGMLWSKQWYHYDVQRWLAGDPAGPEPPAQRLTGRNSGWTHLNNADVISMPDKWEYPWYAAWDLGFHCVALAHLDPEFAKHQLTLLCREWYMHPNGQLPAYEWGFDDVNPPVHAWAALRVFEIDGSGDYHFLERVFHKLLLNFTWWVNRKDAEGNNIFQGGFLGLDNIGPFDRGSAPGGAHLEQSDGTAWMAMYCLNLLELSIVLANHDPTYEDIATKFFEHFTLVATALNDQGLWDDHDGFYYDVLHLPDGGYAPLRARSMVGLIPIFGAMTLGPETMGRLHDFRVRMQWFENHRPEALGVIDHIREERSDGHRLLSIVSPDRLRRILAPMLDEGEFLSPHGLRALSRRHRDHPLRISVGGAESTLDYEPAESTTGLFGGNSNWRGPVWFPVNYLMVESLRRYHRFLGDGYRVECPTGSGIQMTLGQVADELARRLVAIFLESGGRRPVHGGTRLFQEDPAWRGLIPFHEYFNGDDGAGLGASHQTGWTGLVADLIASRPRR